MSRVWVLQSTCICYWLKHGCVPKNGCKQWQTMATNWLYNANGIVLALVIFSCCFFFACANDFVQSTVWPFFPFSYYELFDRVIHLFFSANAIPLHCIWVVRCQIRAMQNNTKLNTQRATKKVVRVALKGRVITHYAHCLCPCKLMWMPQKNNNV